jgi:hypothetical protein
LDNETNRTNAIEGVLNNWIENDPESTGLWVAGLPEGVVREKAATDFVRKVAFIYPEVAAEWTWMIGDPEVRAKFMGVIAERWNDTDPAAAEAWIRDSGVSLDQVRAISSESESDEEIVILSPFTVD